MVQVVGDNKPAKLILGNLVQHFVAVLEVVQNTLDGAVVVVRAQRSKADIF